MVSFVTLGRTQSYCRFATSHAIILLFCNISVLSVFFLICPSPKIQEIQIAASHLHSTRDRFLLFSILMLLTTQATRFWKRKTVTLRVLCVVGPRCYWNGAPIPPTRYPCAPFPPKLCCPKIPHPPPLLKNASKIIPN